MRGFWSSQKKIILCFVGSRCFVPFALFHPLTGPPSSILFVPMAGVTEEALNLQLLGGKMRLKNLTIRETAFAELELPVRASGKILSLDTRLDTQSELGFGEL